MRFAEIQSRVTALLEELPAQQRLAAKPLLDHPDDVALLSMRELARRAGVPPATMTRLAQRLGFEGFEQLRGIYADAVRGRASTIKDSFERRAEGLLARREVESEAALVTDTLAGLAGHLRMLSEPESIQVITQAAELIAASDRVFCIGARSSYAPVYLASYLMAMLGEQMHLIDGARGSDLDALRTLRRKDAVLAVAIEPYTRNTVEAVSFAAERGARLMVITDSHASPLARHAKVAIIVPTETPSFLQTMTPAFVVVECLAALVAAKRGKTAVKAIADAEKFLDRFDAYAKVRSRKRDVT